jgi:hypothetical protein
MYWDRRRQPRYRLEGGLQVHVSIPPAEDILEAELFDVTQAGAGLQLEAPCRAAPL